MYSCTVNIVLCSKSSELVQAVRACTPIPSLSCSIESLPVLTEEAYNTADLLIVDYELFLSFQTRGGVKPLCIFCLSAEQLSQVTPELAERAGGFLYREGSVAYQTNAIQGFISRWWEQKQAWFSQTCLNTLINSVPDLIWFKDLRGAHCKVNDSFCLAVGKEKKDVEGRGHYYIWDIEPEEYAQGEYICLESEEVVIEKGTTCLFDECVKTKEGLRQFKTYKSPVRDERGAIIGTVGIAHDVTNFANVGVELDLLLRNMPFGILIIDANGFIVNSNEHFQTYFLMDPERIHGKSYAVWSQETFRSVHKSLEQNSSDVDICIGESLKTFKVYTSVIQDIFNNNAGMFVLFSDVTREREGERQIKIFAETDLLTGAYNRRFFYQYMQTRSRTDSVTLFFLDLDNLKDINDRYGHQEGDAFIQTVSQLIRRLFPESIQVRFGGDEFLICCISKEKLNNPVEKAELLLREIGNVCTVCSHQHSFSASIGIAETCDPLVSADEIVRRADAAMYAAKKKGKGRVCTYALTMGTGLDRGKLYPYRQGRRRG